MPSKFNSADKCTRPVTVAELFEPSNIWFKPHKEFDQPGIPVFEIMAYTDYANEITLLATESEDTKPNHGSASQLNQNPEKIEKGPKHVKKATDSAKDK